MSDDPERPRVVTAPLGATPAAAPEPSAPVTAKMEPGPVNARPATQMSASAVPSTLESPAEPAAPAMPRAEGALETATTLNAFDPAKDEIHGAAVVRAERARDDAAPANPGGDAAPREPRRGGPATQMSPAVVAPLPGQSTPPLAPEQAVIDVGAPAHAFVPHGSGAPGMYGAHGMHHGGAGAGGAGRSMSTTFVLLIVGGVVAAIALLAVAVLGFVFFTRQRAAERDEPRGSRQPTITVTPGAPDTPRLAPRMGGTRAHVVVTSAGALDAEGVRNAINVAMPHLDPCFAVTELDPPNHESASYELDVAPSGEVRRAEPATPGPRLQKLDACVVQNLRAVRLPRSARASVVKLTLSAPIEPR